MTESPSRYLGALRRSLRRLGVPSGVRRRVVAEARDHILERVAMLERAGYSRRLAREEAERMFGSADEVAASWAHMRVVKAPTPWVTLWVLGTVAGSTLGVTLLAKLGVLIAPLVGMMLVLPLAGGTLGLCLGAAQAILPGARIQGAARWSLAAGAATAVGLTFATAIVESIALDKGRLLDETAALLLIGGLTGMLIGLFQRRMIPDQTREAKSRWVMLNALGGSLGLTAGGMVAVAATGEYRTPLGLLLLAGFAAAALALSTATSLCAKSSRPCRTAGLG